MKTPNKTIGMIDEMEICEYISYNLEIIYKVLENQRVSFE